MKSLQTLIDEACDLCRPPRQAELARVLGVPRSTVNDWRAGRKPMPPACYARIAAMVDGEPTAKEMLWSFITSTEKISATFKSLLRRGMAGISRGCVLA